MSDSSDADSTAEHAVEAFSLLGDDTRLAILLPLLATSVVANGLLGGVWASMPAFADARGGPEAYGLLIAAIAGGMLVGALIASRFEHLPLGRLTVGLYSLSGVSWLAAVLAPSLPTTALLFELALVPVGISNVIVVAVIPSLRQLPRTSELETLALA